jgi:predicted nuclease with RNAse H fold
MPTTGIFGSGSQADRLDLEVVRFIGVSLSGGKQNKACLAVLEYFKNQDKVFLVKLYEKIKTDELQSLDQKIIEIINFYGPEVQSVAFDAPLMQPQCLTCQLECPGIEACQEPQVKWMRGQLSKIKNKKATQKLITPYTQRSVEMYVNTELEVKLDMSDALGANMAPLSARAQFLLKRLSHHVIEVFPRLTVWRLGQTLKIMKSHLLYYRHSVGGEISRQAFLASLSEQAQVFIYKDDMRVMVDNNHGFEAFMNAFTAFLESKGLTEQRPEGFPEKEDWIAFPSKELKVLNGKFF